MRVVLVIIIWCGIITVNGKLYNLGLRRWTQALEYMYTYWGFVETRQIIKLFFFQVLH
jgi:hypothetical protein